MAARYIHIDGDQWYPTANSADLIMIGHFLVENPHSVHTILAKSKDAMRAGGDVIVMERPNDTVIYHAKQVLANFGLTVYDTMALEERNKLIEQTLEHPGKAGISSHYLRATQPDKKHKAELISTYFNAWRHQDIGLLCDVFNENATYIYKPGLRPPVMGLQSIHAYWQRRTLLQSDVKVLVRNVTYTGNVSICAFEGDFDTPESHVIIKGALCFDIDNYSGKVGRLSGHYGVVKTPFTST